MIFGMLTILEACHVSSRNSIVSSDSLCLLMLHLYWTSLSSLSHSMLASFNPLKVVKTGHVTAASRLGSSKNPWFPIFPLVVFIVVPWKSSDRNSPGTYWCAKEEEMCNCTGEITYSPELFDGYVYTVPAVEQAYKARGPDSRFGPK